MILYSLIVRASDGMPLTASIESDNQPHVRDCKRLLKLLGKKVKQFPDRCSLPSNTRSTVHFTTSLGVSYMALCDNTYPVVLAFSFLDELVKEFITTYTSHDISSAHRPYSFIQFDNYIQKTRLRYNNPSSLATKINLAELSLEIKLRPPHILSLAEIEPVTNGIDSISMINNVGPPPRSPPLNSIDFSTILLTVFCSLFNFVRGISALSASSFEDYDGVSPVHGITLLLETLTQCFQIYLLLYIMRRKLIWTILVLLTICLCNLFVWDIRDLWQILIHVGLAAQMTLRIALRRPQKKAPNYNV